METETTPASQQPDSTHFQPPPDSLFPYDLQHPTFIIQLEAQELHEISGLGPTSTPGLLCAISDEKGEVLFIDAHGGGAVKHRVLFREKGDFEGVEMVGDCLYAIKSDGDLYRVKRWKGGRKPKSKKYETGLSKTEDVEGLGYDAAHNCLLVACKGDPDSAYIRPIYAFDLRTKQLNPKPVFVIDPEAVNQRVPYDEQDKKHYFSSSGVAVHPISGDIYVISTALKRVVVLDHATGAILYAARLDKNMFPQPEGIAFDAAGNLFISSEGKKDQHSMLFRFEYQKP
ncbi:MAG: SdiA-regulated domain-containing protein [Saprospiraceae bacterium]|nr:SdiA-regulated domain-containing protein [Saprospiraceae bacterium]